MRTELPGSSRASSRHNRAVVAANGSATASWNDAPAGTAASCSADATEKSANVPMPSPNTASPGCHAVTPLSTPQLLRRGRCHGSRSGGDGVGNTVRSISRARRGLASHHVPVAGVHRGGMHSDENLPFAGAWDSSRHFTSERSTLTTATTMGTTSHTRLVTARCDHPSPASSPLSSESWLYLASSHGRASANQANPTSSSSVCPRAKFPTWAALWSQTTGTSASAAQPCSPVRRHRRPPLWRARRPGPRRWPWPAGRGRDAERG
jgi:hypothetical protein